MALKVALLCFLTIHTIATSILIRLMHEVQEDVYDLKGIYKDLIRDEIKEVNSCFDKWGEAIESLDRAVALNSELLELLRGKEHETD